jgi:uncharacterized protein
MTRRDTAPLGAPCWADLWTSDVEGSRRFYAELFGWEAQDPSAEFAGYFMFARDGEPVAGGMGDMGDVAADNTWKVYLATADAAATVVAAGSNGGQAMFDATPVADLGNQTVLVGPDGAVVGAWEAGTFPGFVVLDEPGAPGWFELHTRGYAEAVPFYRSVFGWQTEVAFDTDELRYTVQVDPADGTQLAGVVDAGTWMPEGAASRWTIYWGTTDTDASVADVVRLGGTVVDGPVDTPYGRIATVTDPSGAEFKLRTPPPA